MVDFQVQIKIIRMVYLMDNIIIGRDNISATIFVPYDCTNKCKFCTTKYLYKKDIDYKKLY